MVVVANEETFTVEALEITWAGRVDRRGRDNTGATAYFSVPYSGTLSIDAERAGSRFYEWEAWRILCLVVYLSFTFAPIHLVSTANEQEPPQGRS